MVLSDRLASHAISTVAKPFRAVRSALQRVDAALDAFVAGLGRKGTATYALIMGSIFAVSAGYLASVLSRMLVPVVAAQAGGGTAAEEIMCQTGAGEAITLAFVGGALLLTVVAGWRLMLGLNKRGSNNKQKKQEGDEHLKGVLYSLGGVFALTAFPLILQYVGLATIHCVTFSPF